MAARLGVRTHATQPLRWTGGREPGSVPGMPDADDLLARLQDKAEHHAREAERYRVAADVLRDELRMSSRATPRTSRAFGEGSPSTPPSDPRTSSMAMVELVLNEADTPMHPNDLVAEMEQRGWQSTATHKVNTVRTAAHRLAAQGRVKHLRDGRFAALGLLASHEEAAATPEPSAQSGSGSSDAVEALI